MKLQFKMKGFRELERALAEDLPRATARNVLRRSASKAMKRIEDAAKRNAPVEDGELRDSIKTEVAKARRSSRTRFARANGVEVATGPSNMGVPFFQEFGTTKMAAHPFMRPAADAEGQNVVNEVREALTEEVNKAKARIARKAARNR